MRQMGQTNSTLAILLGQKPEIRNLLQNLLENSRTHGTRKGNSMKFVGVDLETSGTDHEKSVPIQFGIAFQGEDKWHAWDIGGWKWADDKPVIGPAGTVFYEWNEEAFEVHKITKQRLQIAPTAEQADSLISGAILPRKPEGQRFCMIGWNVAGFDRPFIEKHLPKTFSMFSYRTVDLNAICFALAVPQVRSYDRVKNESKDYALEKMEGHETLWHDAGFDALASLHSYEYLRKMAWSGLGFEETNRLDA